MMTPASWVLAAACLGAWLWLMWWIMRPARPGECEDCRAKLQPPEVELCALCRELDA